MTLQRIIFLLFITSVLHFATPQSNCAYIGNHRVQWIPENDTQIKFTVDFNRGASGYAGIGFKDINGDINDPQQSYFFISSVNRNFIELSGYPNNSNSFEPNVTALVNIKERISHDADRFTLVFTRLVKPPQGLELKNERLAMLIAYNRKQQPSTSSIPPPDELEEIQLNLFENSECPNYETSRDLSSQHILIPFILVLIDATLIALMSWKFGSEPLKSRGITPIIIVLIHMLISACSFPESDYVKDFSIAWKSNYLCYVHQFALQPLLICAMLLIPIHILRFRFFIRFNELKLIYHASGTAEDKVQVRIFKTLTNPFSVLAVLGVFLLIWEVMMLIIAGSFRFQCRSYEGSLKYIALGWHVAILLFTIIAIGYDVIESAPKLFLGRFRELFVGEDHFLFRPEFYGLVLLLIFDVTTVIINAMLKPSSFNVLDTNAWVNMIMTSITHYWMVLFFVIFPLVWTFIWSWRSTDETKKLVKKGALEAILASEKALRQFMKFAIYEGTVENILIYKDMEEFEKIEDPMVQKTKAKEIKDMYLTRLSPLEVHISRSEINETIEKMGRAIELDLFIEIEKLVLENLTDTFDRFRQTPEYKQFENLKPPKHSVMADAEEDEEPKKDVELKDIAIPQDEAKPSEEQGEKKDEKKEEEEKKTDTTEEIKIEKQEVTLMATQLEKKPSDSNLETKPLL